MVTVVEVRYCSPLKAKDKFYVTAEIAAAAHNKKDYKSCKIRNLEDKLFVRASVSITYVDQKTGKGYCDI